MEEGKNISTSKDLLELLKTSFLEEQAKLDPKNFRYVLYARKSTTEDERQVRSIPQQIQECEAMAESEELRIVKIVEEAESAKEPDIRPKFAQLINDIKQGKYDGIVAWHPDRLARNMREGGEIIDLLDKKVIKTLKFKSFTFENDTSGKMLLGIAFVLAKQFSDKLSDDVKRGIRDKIALGKWLSKAKKGYYKDASKFLRPDGHNYTIIKEAWLQRSEGNKTLEEIVEYINSQHYADAIGIGEVVHKPHKFNIKILSEMFQDSFFAGVARYGDNFVNLEEIFDFIPTVDVATFLRMNKNLYPKGFKTRRRGDKGYIVADLMRGQVFCGLCKEAMTSAITNKKLKDGVKKYYNYRCDSKGCKAYGKGTRAHIVVDYAVEYLRTHEFDFKAMYSHYKEEMKSVAKKRLRSLRSHKIALVAARGRCEEEINSLKGYLYKTTELDLRQMAESDLRTKRKQFRELDKEITSVSEAIETNKGVILSYEQFIELFEQLPDKLANSKKLKEKDFILRKIFLNFVLKDKKVASLSLNPPFDRFVKVANFTNSRGGQN